MLNQPLHRVLAGLHVVLQQRSQKRDLVEVDAGRLAVLGTPAFAQVVEHRVREIRARVEFSVLLGARAVEIHPREQQLRFGAAFEPLQRVAWSTIVMVMKRVVARAVEGVL